MKTLGVFVSLFLLTLLFSCQDDFIQDESSGKLVNSKCIVVNDGVKIAILSDIHVMDPSLLVKDGVAFQTYLAKDPKLLEYSSRIFQAAVYKLIAQRPDIVLIPGDLTKDGERISHENVARMLRLLNLYGIHVLVAVGNHDVNNPEAQRFINARTVSVPTVQANRIPFIYANYGFRNAISRDPYSLSYVNEPARNLWVISIDANKYYDNTTRSITGGAIKPETLNWIKLQLAKAKNRGKTVIGMMHHGLIEHYTGQQMIDSGYVVDNWPSVADTLINAGLKIILTGHYHATDITKREFNGKFLFDVETGSTVNYPCTYRMLTIKGNKFSFKPQNTTGLMKPGFDNYAKTFLSDHLDVYFDNVLNLLYKVPEPYAKNFAPYFKAGAMAHFAGDEAPTASVMEQIATLNTVDPTGQLGNVLGSLWTDINTPDNTVTIDMETGAAE